MIYRVSSYLCPRIPWGRPGFDSMKNRYVSMSGVVKPARKSRTQNFNWRKKLRSCCLIES